MTMTSREQIHLIGHESIENDLLNAWKQDRLPHSLLLTGPKGVGRATLAFRLAKFLLSDPQTHPDSFAVTPDHPVARRVISGGHGDLLVLEPDLEKVTKDISVDQVRKVKHFLSQTPMEGGWRIVIVDGEMNGSAANAILKVLEEPPKKSLLILMTESAGRVLPTIRSRCYQIKMKPLKEDQVAKVIKAARPSLTQEEIRVLTALCDGCPGQALQYYEAEAVEMYHELLDLLRHLSPFDYSSAMKLCQKYSGKGKKDNTLDTFQVMGDCLRRFIQKLTRYATLHDTLSTIPEEIPAFQHALTIRPAPEWAKVWERLNKIFHQAQRFHLDKTQVMFCSLCEMAGVRV